ncbi:hypothetical protein GCM10010363_29490 [Streptomyces omiyaensis]|nr:hypothetical protein GCM10010363_29490 [Streptomyces omiyaensis]
MADEDEVQFAADDGDGEGTGRPDGEVGVVTGDQLHRTLHRVGPSVTSSLASPPAEKTFRLGLSHPIK